MTQVVLGDPKSDDPAIWVHPADPSLIIGTDKDGGLGVYTLDGLADGRRTAVERLAFLPTGR